jgi:tartrate dehydratase alpha subunit/fumarate hydratase class I-like protein
LPNRKSLEKKLDYLLQARRYRCIKKPALGNKNRSKQLKSSQITQDELKIARVKTGSGVLKGGGKIFLKKIKIENYDRYASLENDIEEAPF